MNLTDVAFFIAIRVFAIFAGLVIGLTLGSIAVIVWDLRHRVAWLCGGSLARVGLGISALCGLLGFAWF
jgi:hypothetical protein